MKGNAKRWKRQETEKQRYVNANERKNKGKYTQNEEIQMGRNAKKLKER